MADGGFVTHQEMRDLERQIGAILARQQIYDSQQRETKDGVRMEVDRLEREIQLSIGHLRGEIVRVADEMRQDRKELREVVGSALSNMSEQGKVAQLQLAEQHEAQLHSRAIKERVFFAAGLLVLYGIQNAVDLIDLFSPG